MITIKNSKAKKIITTGLTVLVTAMVGLNGLIKAIQLPLSVEDLVKFKLSNYETMLGLMEIIFIILFAFPKTIVFLRGRSLFLVS